MSFHVPTVAANALGLAIPQGKSAADKRCAMCGIGLNGIGVSTSFGQSFVDYDLLADPHSHSICTSCAALQHRTALTAASASGVVSASGFKRLLSTVERVAFLMDPPPAPFAVGIVNATQQHIWWHTPASYSRDQIAVRYGLRTLVLDRLTAIEIADIIRAFELTQRPGYRAFYTLTRSLKMPHDGMMKTEFMNDKSAEAAAIKRRYLTLDFGTVWAAQQLLIACRSLSTTTCAQAHALVLNQKGS